MSKDKARRFDGISRPSTDLYKKNFDLIFGPKKIKKTNKKMIKTMMKMAVELELQSACRNMKDVWHMQNRPLRKCGIEDIKIKLASKKQDINNHPFEQGTEKQKRS